MRCSARAAATTSPPGACRGRSAGARDATADAGGRRRRAAGARPGRTRPAPGGAAGRSAPVRLGRRGVDRPGLVRGAGQSRIRCPRRVCPTVVPLRHARSWSAGRRAAATSTPTIDCETDSGVSRRQAQLTTDGSRWCVEDLDSANGTFVGSASGAAARGPDPGRGQARARPRRPDLPRRLDPAGHPRGHRGRESPASASHGRSVATVGAASDVDVRRDAVSTIRRFGGDQGRREAGQSGDRGGVQPRRRPRSRRRSPPPWTRNPSSSFRCPRPYGAGSRREDRLRRPRRARVGFGSV